MKLNNLPIPRIPLLLLAAIAPQIRAQTSAGPSDGDQAAVPAANLFRAQPPEFSKEVAEAPVRARTVVPEKGERGGGLVLERVSPPAPEPPADIPAPAVAVRPWTAEQRAAMRQAAPARILLFAPSILIFEGGLSRISYSSPVQDPAGDPARVTPRFGEYVVWTTANLESIRAVGDLNVGKTRWLVSPSVVRVSEKGVGGRFAGSAKVPALAEFGPPGEASILVEKGNPGDAAALEPVMALLARYADPVESVRIAEDFARMTAFQEAAAAWEKENPEPVRDTVIKFWPVESTEYPAAAAAGAPALPVPAVPTPAVK